MQYGDVYFSSGCVSIKNMIRRPRQLAGPVTWLYSRQAPWANYMAVIAGLAEGGQSHLTNTMRTSAAKNVGQHESLCKSLQQASRLIAAPFLPCLAPSPAQLALLHRSGQLPSSVLFSTSLQQYSMSTG